MELLLCHLVGDYCLQNQAMATNKTHSSLWCLVHVTLYTLPFLFLTQSPLALSIIAGTHFLIDRFSLAAMWTRFYGIGCSSEFWTPKQIPNHPWEFGPSTCQLVDNPEWEEAPDYLRVWLRIIVDNTWHLAINYFAVGYCG